MTFNIGETWTCRSGNTKLFENKAADIPYHNSFCELDDRSEPRQAQT